ncbi:hypothetical protein ACXWOK_10270, partial [Streptococcus pyogenes]
AKINIVTSRWAGRNVCAGRKRNRSKPIKSVFGQLGMCFAPLVAKINIHTSRWAGPKVCVGRKRKHSKPIKRVFGQLGMC